MNWTIKYISNKSKHLISIVFFFGFFLISGCSKKEINVTNGSAILSFPDIPLLEKSSMIANDKGELIVGLPIWNNGSVDIRVLCIDADRKIKWDRKLGGNKDEYVQKLFVDKKGNVLVVGMTFGFEDSTNLASKSRDKFYLHYLTSEGLTIWEKGIAANYGSNVWYGSEVLGIQEDASGNFLISAYYGNNFYVQGDWVDGHFGTLAIVSPDGVLNDIYIFGENPFYAPHQTTLGCGVFYTDFDGAGLVEFDKSDIYRIPEDEFMIPSPKTVDWSWKDPGSPIIGIWESSPSSGKLQFIVVKKEGFILFDYLSGASGLTAKELNLMEILGSTNSVAISSGNKQFLFADSNGEVFVLNESWELISRFKTQWNIIGLSAISNGNIAVAFQKNDIIQIMIYNSNGEAID